MKKNIIIFSLLIMAIVMLSQCSKDNEVNFKDNNETSKNTESIASGTLKNKNKSTDEDNPSKEDTKDEKSKISTNKSEKSEIKNKNKSEDEEIEEFYGKWNVKKVNSYGKDTLKNNSNYILGKTIEFSKDKIVYDGKEYNKPSYMAKEVSDSDFFKSNNKKLSDFQIDNDSVQELKVGNSDDMGIGNTYVWKNSDTLIMIKNGDYYELKKE